MKIERCKTEDYNNLIKKIESNNRLNSIYSDIIKNYYDYNTELQKYILIENVSENIKDRILFLFKYFEKRKSYKNTYELAKSIRYNLEFKKVISIFAYNSTGKTRLSTDFKLMGKIGNIRDTLYYNAYTEDLFTWNNDLNSDKKRFLKYNKKSRFFEGIDGLSIETRINQFFHKFTDIEIKINTTTAKIFFKRKIGSKTFNYIKISRGEERIFIFCFFLAIMNIAIDNSDDKHASYEWVKYVFIDDPVSSLDDNNIVIMMALLKDLINIRQDKIKFIITTHHSLFFNLLSNNFKDVTSDKYFMMLKSNKYIIKNTNDIPSFYHISIINMLKEAVKKDDLYQYHFHFLRILYEKIASFLGYENFTDCLEDGEDKEIYKSLLNVSSHGGYFIYEPEGMIEDNKKHFCNILNYMIKTYKFNEKGINCNKYNIRNRR